MPFNPFSALTSKIFGGSSLALLMALALSHCSDKRHTAQRDEARATIAKMEQASEQARQAQIAVNLATEARYRAEAEKTDAEHQKELALARSASDHYARAHGLRAYCAGGSDQALAPAEDNAPQGGDRPGAPANVVVVQRNDYDLLVDNSLRLKAVHDWGQSLVKEGLAVPEPGFGE